jgi:hypothetical protein
MRDRSATRLLAGADMSETPNRIPDAERNAAGKIIHRIKDPSGRVIITIRRLSKRLIAADIGDIDDLEFIHSRYSLPPTMVGVKTTVEGITSCRYLYADREVFAGSSGMRGDLK